MNFGPMVVAYLCGDFPYAAEFQSFLMAIQGAMAVRNGPNKNKSMAWFHAFAQSVVAAYAGALLAPLWMGRPTSMLSNDINLLMCVVSFVLVNYSPFNICYHFFNFLPIKILVTSGAQLFRALGLVKFTTMGYEAFKHAPSKYYPTPIVGPILWATLLGNMGGFFTKGFHGHLKDGMPWPFQNGFFCASLFLFTVHDKGPIGETLRQQLEFVEAIKFGYEEKEFATFYVSAFMQIVGILQLTEFLGPSFSPFCTIYSLGSKIATIFTPGSGSQKKKKIEMITRYDNSGNSNAKSGKSKKNKKQKKS